MPWGHMFNFIDTWLENKMKPRADKEFHRLREEAFNQFVKENSLNEEESFKFYKILFSEVERVRGFSLRAIGLKN